MINPINMPTIVTTLEYKKFKMHVVAYRRLSDAELKFQLRQLMRQKGWKKIPTSGEFKVFSVLGYVGQQ